MTCSMEKMAEFEAKVIGLMEKVRFYEEENRRLADIQHKLEKINNNFLMLHYLNRKVQDCCTSETLWKTFLRNISDAKGFDYGSAVVFLSNEMGILTTKHCLKDGRLCTNAIKAEETAEYIKLAIEKKACSTTADQRRVAVPMINHFGNLKGVLTVTKASEFLVEDIELLDFYIQQTIATIENVTLNERLLHYQDLLGKRLDQFVLLHYLAKEINGGTDYYDILRKYLQALQSPMGFNFEHCTLYVFADDATQRAYLADEQLCLEPVDTVGPLIAEAVKKKCGALSERNTVFAMPLLAGGKVSAVIEIVNAREIGLEQIQILEILAMQTSSALDNARLRMNLEHMSYHDALTGLYNRAFFEKHVRLLRTRAKTSVGMMMCDVNDLKFINDTIGHQAGDALIVAAANAIKGALNGNAVAARVGGDEFAVLVSPCSESEMAAIYREIQANAQQYNHKELSFTLEMAMGWAFSDDTPDFDELFRCADRKMYEEKKMLTLMNKKRGRLTTE